MAPYLYSVIIQSPGLLLQIDLATFQIVNTIQVSQSTAHVIASDGQYVYVGTIGQPIQVIKVKVPEMAIDSLVNITEASALGVKHLRYINSKLYAGIAGIGALVEIDPVTMTRQRTFTFFPSGIGTVEGTEYLNGNLYSTASEPSIDNLELVEINPQTFTEIRRITIDSNGIVDFGPREVLVAEGMLYLNPGGSPSRIFEVSPNTLTVTRTVTMPGSNYADRIIYDGSQYLYVNNDQAPAAVTRINRATFAYERLDLPSGDGAFDVDIDGTSLYATVYFGQNIAEIDLQSFSFLRNLPVTAGRPAQTVVGQADGPPPPPELTLAIDATPRSGQAPLQVGFTAIATGMLPFTFNWVFGDGGTSTEMNPAYTYSNAGLYTVICTLTDGLGRQTSDSVTITVTELLPPPLTGKKLGFWMQASTTVDDYDADTFFNAMFLAPPYPAFLEMMIGSASQIQRYTPWLDRVASLADAYPNIELAYMVAFNMSDEADWTVFENFVEAMRNHTSVNMIGIMGEYATSNSATNMQRAKDIVEARGKLFVSYFIREVYGPSFLEIGHINWPSTPNRGGLEDALDWFSTFPPYIGLSHGYYYTMPFPDDRPLPDNPRERTIVNHGWSQEVIKRSIDHTVLFGDTVRHVLSLCVGFSGEPTNFFTGVSGINTNRLWDNPLLRQWIWENPNYQGNFVLSTGSPPPPAPTGILSVDTTPPKGEVIVNGTPRGVALQTMTLDIGSYVLSFGQVEGYDPPPARTVQVFENQTTTILAQYTEKPPPDLLYILVPVAVSLTLIGVGAVIWIGERG